MMQFLSFSIGGSICGIGCRNICMPSLRITQSTRAAAPEGLKACSDDGLKKCKSANVQGTKVSKERIRKQLHKVDLSASSYDTAWVAMVPLPEFRQVPCFPECLNWIIENQHPDGSWGIHRLHPSLVKDALSSTLACVLALKRWNVGEEHVRRGLHFIGSYFSSAMDGKLHTPIGFDIIFPGMLGYAIEMGLDLPIGQNDIDAMFYLRDLELQRVTGNSFEGRKAYLAYVAEGLGKSQDWHEVMKYQRENGSLFNSPSTTAAALSHIYDAEALEYLRSLLQKFGSSVPTSYPIDIYTLLCVVDKIERLGIARHFSYEIKNVLDKIYRCWLKNDEEINTDMGTRAMAFRLLRMNGFDISSAALTQFGDSSFFFNSIQGHLKDMKTVLELYKASQIKILPMEQILDKLGSWSSNFLREELSTNSEHGLQVLSQEVDYAFKFPFYANLERLEHKNYIENFKVENFQVLKTSYTSSGVDDKDLLELALEDFNLCQSIYRKELQYIESWVKENRLDQLEFARQKQTFCYFSAAATLFSPESFDARMSWAKNGVLTTVVDDFFDHGGSREELVNLISLIEKWDENHDKQFCSEQVKIIYSAICSTINELGAKASALQKRSVTDHLVEIWLTLVKAMMKEAEWVKTKTVPTMDEYMANGYVSFALGPIILPALYFVGPEISVDAIGDPEYHNLYKLVSLCGRLLNDMQSFEREGKEGKLSSVLLRIAHGSGSTSEEEAIMEIQSIVDSSRAELLRLVLQNEGSVVPRACKDLFWKMSRILHLFYMKNDGFTSPTEMVSAVNAVIYEPLKVGHIFSLVN
ncbi:ent-kaur-16-ene synthase, chloroplastic isoform X1 [Phoenix dactylifera]|uniref:Ent-kaur-16-ene synthase, chloroplastic isoform X1 n=2 Tax=Phoenix dactylifera TaxID=42345 RepID=A0A8B7CYI5_PHODC|nr:ent-kaur-16-ene synthase, chloroplastic isoform X1 [Phoenix dactylifera]XP_026665755.1 ent-kaur-16-ene synthase, chloroplastic isoform X1 [Phoenix dactylifera]